MTGTNAFIEIQDVIEPTFNEQIAKPSYYHDKHGSNLIISTHYNEDLAVPGIYKYNMNTNKMNKIYEYHKHDDSKSWAPLQHGQFIDTQNDNFYIVGGWGYSFAALHLKTNQITHDKSSKFCKLGPWPTVTYVSNEIHIMDGNCKHLIFKSNEKRVIEPKANTLCNDHHVYCPKLLYVAVTNKLMIMGSMLQDKIFYCDLNDYQWKLYKLRMPAAPQHTDYDILLAFDKIIFVFYFTGSVNTKIWCLDIMSQKWFKSPQKMPEITDSYKDFYAIKDINNMVHIMHLFADTGYRFKASLHDLIPTDLQKLHTTHYEKLVVGYTKQMEKHNITRSIPSAIKHLISGYFPIFI